MLSIEHDHAWSRSLQNILGLRHEKQCTCGAAGNPSQKAWRRLKQTLCPDTCRKQTAAWVHVCIESIQTLPMNKSISSHVVVYRLQKQPKPVESEARQCRANVHYLPSNRNMTTWTTLTEKLVSKGMSNSKPRIARQVVLLTFQSSVQWYRVCENKARPTPIPKSPQSPPSPDIRCSESWLRARVRP
jgi:hypothetical protein